MKYENKEIILIILILAIVIIWGKIAYQNRQAKEFKQEPPQEEKLVEMIDYNFYKDLVGK